MSLFDLMESRQAMVCPQCQAIFYKWHSSKQRYCSRFCSDQNVKGTHGLTGTPEHRLWKAMRWRCNERNPYRERYFDRGIKVCPRWDNFLNFLEDMGKKPTPKHTLDRIDNDLGYSPTNCRWATMKEQANNTRRTNYVIHDGRRVNLMDIQAATGIHPETLRARIRKGWSYDKIIGTPLKATLRERDDYGQFI